MKRDWFPTLTYVYVQQSYSHRQVTVKFKNFNTIQSDDHIDSI